MRTFACLWLIWAGRQWEALHPETINRSLASALIAALLIAVVQDVREVIR